MKQLCVEGIKGLLREREMHVKQNKTIICSYYCPQHVKNEAAAVVIVAVVIVNSCGMLLITMREKQEEMKNRRKSKSK